MSDFLHCDLLQLICTISSYLVIGKYSIDICSHLCLSSYLVIIGKLPAQNLILRVRRERLEGALDTLSYTYLRLVPERREVRVCIGDWSKYVALLGPSR